MILYKEAIILAVFNNEKAMVAEVVSSPFGSSSIANMSALTMVSALASMLMLS